MVRVVNSDYRAPKPAKGKAKRHDPWAGAKGKPAPTRYATPAPAQASPPATVSRASQGRLYLAYGSNLHRGQMRQRCPNAVPLGGMLLHDARLIFRGVADVEYAPGHQVPVGLWRISAQDEAALDRYEGVGGGFYIKETVELSDGREALIYLMTSTGVAPPSEYYIETLRKGYRQFELDTAYLDQAVRHSWVKKEHDDQTLARRGRQRQSALHNRLAKMPERVAINLMKARASQIET